MKLIIISCVFASFLNSVENVEPEYSSCDYDINTGSCGDSFIGYAFNKTSNQCEKINGPCEDFHVFFFEDSCESVCEDVCHKKVAPGDCTGYAFNKTSTQCEIFSNGACDVKGNYFETEKACEEACGNRCNRKIVSGDCIAYQPSFGYNQTTNQCVYFNYGGCFGNENRFPTEDECEETCEDDPCKMLIKSGPCYGIIPRFGYDKTSGQCVKFVYGGCEPNANNFETMEKCQNQCEDVCNNTIETGPCKAMVGRYAYNKTSGQCVQFIYGGCGGNGNNFQLEKDCEDKCEAGCDKPIDSGASCGPTITRWGYNEATGECQTFDYYGCLGNGNNYETEEDCEANCEK